MTRHFTKHNETVQFKMGEMAIISDPCYKKVLNSDSCQLVIDTVPGEWEARVELSDEGVWGTRVVALIAYSLEYSDESDEDQDAGEVCVDSGQMSIVSLDAYEGSNDGWDDPETFYGDACALTLAEGAFGGLLKGGRGVVSSSGYGDGGYRVALRYNATGAVVQITVFFIEDEDDEEEEDDEGDW